MSQVFLAESEAQIRRCYPVMVQLRPAYSEENFVGCVATQQTAGYSLAALETADNHIGAVAGFRISENLAWGRFLYVDDFVTDNRQRSLGLGKTLLQWLTDFARQQGCQQLHLDSGTQRERAHAFYLREGMALSSYHFCLPL